MKVLISHPTSNQNNRAVVNSLEKTGLLHEFHTTIAAFPNSILDRLSNFKALNEVKRRGFNSSLKPYTKSFPWLEMGRLATSKFGLHNFYEKENDLFSVDTVYRNMDRRVASKVEKYTAKDISVVYGYEDGALESFKKAKELGISCFYELPIAFWKTRENLMNKEIERLPEWAATWKGGLTDSIEKLDRKTQELRLADTVIVPSTFVKDSLPDWAKEKRIIMVPFGTPSERANLETSREYRDETKPLRVLFVGSMSQRKGLADVFRAVNLLNTADLELVVLGSLQAPMEFYRNQLKNFTYEKGRPHNEVLELMKSCDVFCLPSIAEGRALVMQEAMSQGLPIIITPNTGGEDLVKEGETGFLVPVSSPEIIADKINWFLENRSKIPLMGKMAQEHASKYTWEKYGDTIVTEIHNTIQNR